MLQITAATLQKEADHPLPVSAEWTEGAARIFFVTWRAGYKCICRIVFSVQHNKLQIIKLLFIRENFLIINFDKTGIIV